MYPRGSGLAGLAIALGYGVMGALAGLVLAGVLAWKLPVWLLRLTAWIALLLSTLSALFIGYRVVEQQHASLALHLDVPVERAPALVGIGNDRPRPHRARVPVESLLFPGDGHVFIWLSRKRAKMRAEISWFEHYLLGRSRGEGGTCPLFQVESFR